MAKWIIKFNIGYGDEYEIIEAENESEAETIAYEAWRAAAEDKADYGAQPYTKEAAIDAGLEDEE